MSKWYVGGMDSIESEHESKQKAILSAMCAALDYRKRPAIKRLAEDFYEYTAPKECSTFATLYLGTKEALLAQGFDAQLDEWENKGKREAEMPDMDIRKWRVWMCT